MRVVHRHFSSSAASWESLFDEAAAFATRVGRDRLISISHSHNGPNLGGLGVVTVWYWEGDEGGPGRSVRGGPEP
jgi:hypothetical protein